MCFAEINDHRIISQEEAVFEEEEFYKIMKKWLVKFENKESELEALLDNCVDDDKAILYERELEDLEEVKPNGKAIS